MKLTRLLNSNLEALKIDYWITPMLSLAKYGLSLRLAGMAADFYNHAIARRSYYYSVQQLKRAARCFSEAQQSSGSMRAMRKDIAIYHFCMEGKTHTISPKTLSLYLQEYFSFSFSVSIPNFLLCRDDAG